MAVVTRTRKLGGAIVYYAALDNAPLTGETAMTTSTIIAYTAGVIATLLGAVSPSIVNTLLKWRNRRIELTVEKRLDSSAGAYARLKAVITLLERREDRLAKNTFDDNEGWFWSNRFWLSDEVANLWLSCRNRVTQIQKPTTPDSLRREAIEKANDANNIITKKIFRRKALKPT